MAQRGGKRVGAGRKPGATSQAKRDLAGMAKDLAEQALGTLADVMVNGQSEQARISAANSILDRGYGKPFQAQPEEAPDDAPAVKWQIEVRDAVGAVRVTKPE